MCGIAGGAWTKSASEITGATLRRMTEAIRHRGPDGDGFYRSPEAHQNHGSAGCALGHRRLSIIDIAGGAQPLSNESGDVWTILNGEIYNYRELRTDLIRKGHRFQTESDTEVIVHLYEEFGEQFVHHLRGMFAIAVWDQPRGRLVLVRDRMGQKPVFYCERPDQLAFASELKALLQVPGMSRNVDSTAIDAFLTYQYVPHPQSIFTGIKKLPPAHFATWDNGVFRVQQYWHPPYEKIAPVQSHEDWKRELRETLTESIRLRLRSDVPVGAFLSGGIDSTIIAGLMQQESPNRIHTFSIGFPVKEYDERSFARLAAQHLKTEHHEFLVTPDALESLPKLAWHYDEPFGDSSAIPTMALSKVTKDFVTVALSGDGGDELFAGYSRYQAVRLAGKMDWLPQPLKSLLAWKLWQKIPTSTRQGSLGRRGKKFLQAVSQSPERRYFRWIGIFDHDLRNSLYTDKFKAKLQGYESAQFLDDAYGLYPDRDFLTRTTAVDVATYLPCDILTKVDVASMAYALEARSPFLDHKVAELAARMPIELKFDSKLGKKILIETFADLLPEAIWKRPKMGFGIPIDHWLRNEYRDLLPELLLSDRALDRGIFKREAVSQLIFDHLSKKWDHAYRLWNLMILELWHRIYVDNEPTITPPASLEELGCELKRG